VSAEQIQHKKSLSWDKPFRIWYIHVWSSLI